MAQFSHIINITQLVHSAFSEETGVCNMCPPGTMQAHSKRDYGNRHRHLTRKHLVEWKQLHQAWCEEGPRPAKEAEKRRLSRISQKLKKEEIVPVINEEEFHFELLLHIIKNHLPFTTVQCEHLQKILAFKPFTANTYMSRAEKLADDVRGTIKTELQKQQSIAITTDGWTSTARHFMTVTAHWITNEG